MQNSDYSRKKRTPNACIPCRQSKIKCTGDEPCTNCRRRLVRCRFAEPSASRHSRSESLRSRLQVLPNLENYHERPQSAVSVNKQSTFDSADASDETVGPLPAELGSTHEISKDHSIWTSPFAQPFTTILNAENNKRNWIWLAPSSAWSFTVRLALVMTKRLELGGSPYNMPNFVDKMVYPLEWKTGSAVNEPPDVSGLPSLDDARYHFNTVKFHIGPIYRLLDESTFLSNLDEFYGNNPAATEKASESRLWFVQFLLILTLGKALLSQSKSAGGPPGAKLFKRAMSLMPDHGYLWRDGLMAIDVLALAGLYLYCIDHRESAHVYVCQAIRIAQLKGLHTQLPESELGEEIVARCRNLWWTLYIMDRHFSSSLGIPMTTQDRDISTLLDLNELAGQRDPTLRLQVRLWGLLSTIVSSIYKTEKTELGEFLEATRSILQTLAGHAHEIERIVHINLQNSVEIISRRTRHIALLYHECVIFATRPLLLSVLMNLLNFNHEMTSWQGLLALTKSLVSTGVKSAVKTLQILSDEDNILGSFLPFDLESLYAAALHLLMAGAIFPDMGDSQPFNQRDAHILIDDLVQKGNRVAEARKAELVFLEAAFQEFTRRVQQQGLQTMSWSDAVEDSRTDTNDGTDPTHLPHHLPDGHALPQAVSGVEGPLPASLADSDGIPQMGLSTLPQTPADAAFLDNIGISADDFLNIVDQMATQDFDAFGLFGQSGVQ